MLAQLLEELRKLQDAEQLLFTVLTECSSYGYKIEGMSNQTHQDVQKFMKFDDSE